MFDDMAVAKAAKSGSIDDNLTILQNFLPKAILQPMTAEAAEAVSVNLIDNVIVKIKKLPFRVGRESRVVKVNGRLERVERPKEDDSEPNNDLYLVDRGHRLHISRKHFQIEKRNEKYYLVDRGSSCGLNIGGKSLGGDDAGGEAPLHDGDIIGVGRIGTPYIFQFVSFDDYEIVRKK